MGKKYYQNYLKISIKHKFGKNYNEIRCSGLDFYEEAKKGCG